jgi:hypothetical protein
VTVWTTDEPWLHVLSDTDPGHRARPAGSEPAPFNVVLLCPPAEVDAMAAEVAR